MFSRKTLMIAGVLILITISIIALSMTSRRHVTDEPGPIAIAFIPPFQKILTHLTNAAQDLWRHYFDLVRTAHENDRLRHALALSVEESRKCREVELANQRLRDLLKFKEMEVFDILAAEVVGRDPSVWFKTIVIDKGKIDGVTKGLPVVSAQGIVGQVISSGNRYAKVLLLTDPASAADALIQRSRSRGVVKGNAAPDCLFDYAVRNDDIQIGDWVISSGLDGVYPKGLVIGQVTRLMRPNDDLFQEVIVSPAVDFEKIEEVLIILNPEKPGEERIP